MSQQALSPDTPLPELYILAERARETLRAQLKDTAREYSDRVKQLDNLKHQILLHSGTRSDQLDGLAKLSLSPELQKLLVNPTHGL